MKRHSTTDDFPRSIPTTSGCIQLSAIADASLALEHRSSSTFMFEAEGVPTMSSKRFIPCAAIVLGLLGFGGHILAHDPDACTRVCVAAFYIIAGFTVIALRRRIAVWWSSSTLLPYGCAALLMLAGINGLSRVEWRQLPPVYTNSSTPSPQTVPADFRL